MCYAFIRDGLIEIGSRFHNTPCIGNAYAAEPITRSNPALFLVSCHAASLITENVCGKAPPTVSDVMASAHCLLKLSMAKWRVQELLAFNSDHTCFCRWMIFCQFQFRAMVSVVWVLCTHHVKRLMIADMSCHNAHCANQTRHSQTARNVILTALLA